MHCHEPRHIATVRMFTDCMSSPWNFYACPDKNTLRQNLHIMPNRRLWIGKAPDPFHPSTDPYWYDWIFGDKALQKARLCMIDWKVHEKRCALLDHKRSLRLALCMSAHPRLGSCSSLGLLQPEHLESIVEHTWFG